MNKHSPAGSAARAVAHTFVVAALSLIAVLAAFGMFELNAWLSELIVGKRWGYAPFAVFMSLCVLETAVVLGAYNGFKAYRRARHG